MSGPSPPRLNLAVARRCFVACDGCYQNFGHQEPDLSALVRSVARFVELGITAVTLSGGDPLTLHDLPRFIAALREQGVRDLKLDTVGTPLLRRGAGGPVVRTDRLSALLAGVDHLGLPLDGASEASMRLFRSGRRSLHGEVSALLDAMDAHPRGRRVVVNTVLHRSNVDDVVPMHDQIRRHRSVVHWNIFQYTPTDQTTDTINERLSLDETTFLQACAGVVGSAGHAAGGPRIEARSSRSRLGLYLLVNSDGQCWLPDERGRTVDLGPMEGREHAVLRDWAAVVQEIREAVAPVARATPEVAARVGAGA